MKNQLITLFFAVFILVAPITAFCGGVIVEIVTPKHATTITIPDKYVKQDGNLSLPLEIEIQAAGKQPIIFTSSSSTIELSNLGFTGEAQVIITIGKEKFTNTIYL